MTRVSSICIAHKKDSVNGTLELTICYDNEGRITQHATGVDELTRHERKAELGVLERARADALLSCASLSAGCCC